LLFQKGIWLLNVEYSSIKKKYDFLKGDRRYDLQSEQNGS